METVKSILSKLKNNVLKDEYINLVNDDRNIAKLYDIVINSHNDKLYAPEVFLLMSEYLSINKYPMIRESIRLKYQYEDSYIEENMCDLDKINQVNQEIINILLLHDKNFSDAYQKAFIQNNNDQYLINLIKNCQNKSKPLTVSQPSIKNLNQCGWKIRRVKYSKK